MTIQGSSACRHDKDRKSTSKPLQISKVSAKLTLDFDERVQAISPIFGEVVFHVFTYLHILLKRKSGADTSFLQYCIAFCTNDSYGKLEILIQNDKNQQHQHLYKPNKRTHILPDNILRGFLQPMLKPFCEGGPQRSTTPKSLCHVPIDTLILNLIP